MIGLAEGSAGSAFQNYLFSVSWNGGTGGDCGGSDAMFQQITKAPPSGKGLYSRYIVYPVDVAYDSANSWVYVLDAQGYFQANLKIAGTLERFKPDGSAASTVITQGLYVANGLSLGIDSRNVYVPDWGNNRVVSCPLTGTCPTPTTVMVVPSPRLAYSDGKYVWVFANETVYQCNAGSTCVMTPPTTFATGKAPSHITSDGSFVYWTDPPANQVLRCAIGGCGGQPTVLATPSSPSGLVADSTAIYWSDNDGIKKLAK
jgi:sugar lactone lactonase YvrE